MLAESVLRPGSKEVFIRRLLAWGREHRRSFPWRTETDPFRILVAEVMLQRSRGKTVARVYENLFARWRDAEALSRARVTTIEKVIRPLGLTSRARTLKVLSAEIVRRGGVSRSIDELLELPGVGRYAASATAAVAFGKWLPTVDGVTARVYRRYFGLPSDAPAVADARLWELVASVTPRKAVREWNWAVLDLASGVCMPARPRCHSCPLRYDCAWSQAQGVAVSPGH